MMINDNPICQDIYTANVKNKNKKAVLFVLTLGSRSSKRFKNIYYNLQ